MIRKPWGSEVVIFESGQVRVKQLECEALDRSWEATDETDKKGDVQ